MSAPVEVVMSFVVLKRSLLVRQALGNHYGRRFLYTGTVLEQCICLIPLLSNLAKVAGMPPPALNIAIGGRGIAGLVATLTIHETGHNVIVYEKYPGAQTTRGSLSIMLNGVRALKQIGLDH